MKGYIFEGFGYGVDWEVNLTGAVEWRKRWHWACLAGADEWNDAYLPCHVIHRVLWGLRKKKKTVHSLISLCFVSFRFVLCCLCVVECIIQPYKQECKLCRTPGSAFFDGSIPRCLNLPLSPHCHLIVISVTTIGCSVWFSPI